MVLKIILNHLGSQSTNKNLGSSSNGNCNPNRPNQLQSQPQIQNTNPPDHRDTHVDMEEARRAAEQKAEELQIQAEKALKQQEEEDAIKKSQDEIYQPGGGVYLYT